MSQEQFARLFLTAQDDFITGASIVSESGAWKKSSWVRACVDVIVESFMGLPVELYRGQTKIESHPFLDLLARPNRLLGWSQHDLLSMTVLLIEVFGECFWLLDREGGRRGVPGSIWLYNPHYVKEQLSPSKRWVDFWIFRDADGRRYRVEPEEVVQFKYAGSPINMFRGAGPLEAAGIATSSDIAAARYNLSFFDRGAVADGIYFTEEDLPPDTADDLLGQIKTKLVGRGHEPLLLYGGLKFQSTYTSARDSEFLGGRKLNRSEILAAYKVPPVLVGIDETAPYATARQQIRSFWQTTMKPLIRRVSEPIQQKILLEPNLWLSFSVDGVEELQDTLQNKIESGTKLWEMGVPYNSIEKLLEIGTGPIEGGDIGYLDLRKVPIETIAEDDEPEPEPIDEETEKAFAPFIQTLIGSGREHFVNDETSISAVIWNALNPFDSELRDLVHPYYEEAFKIGAEQMLDLIGRDVIFDQPKLAAELIETKLLKVTGLNKTTRDQLRAVLRESLEAGETVDELAERIRTVFHRREAAARTIARTELGQTVNGARFLITREEGIEKHEWLSARNERVRASHIGEDSNIVTVGEPFPVTGLIYPGDVNGPVAETANCLCLAIVPDPKRAQRDLRTKMWRNAVKEWQPLERRLANDLKKYFFAQRAAVLEAIHK